jgi:hypothetical protein
LNEYLRDNNDVNACKKGDDLVNNLGYAGGHDMRDFGKCRRGNMRDYWGGKNNPGLSPRAPSPIICRHSVPKAAKAENMARSFLKGDLQNAGKPMPTCGASDR